MREKKTTPEKITLSGWKQFAFGSFAILLLVFLIYFPAIHGEFLWDDLPLYIDRSIIISPHGLETIWIKTVWFTTDFPLTLTTFWLEHRLWGKNPTGYHVTNFLLHAFGAILLWRVLLRLRIRGAFFAALIFAVHPVCVASVAWISERKNTLSLVFFLLSLQFFLRSEQAEDRIKKPNSALFYWLSLLAFFLAVLSKTSIIALPLVLLGIAWWQRGKITARDFLKSLPFFLLSIGFGLLTIYSQDRTAIRNTVVQIETFPARFVESAWAIWFYLWKIFVPTNLTPIYPHWELPKVSLLSLFPLAALAGIFFLLWWRRKTWGRHGLLALGYFVVMLFPILGFIDMFFLIYSRVADHWQYVPLIGIIVLAVAGISYFLEKKFSIARNARIGLGAAVVFILCALTWNHAKIYASEEKLWTDNIKKNPKAWMAYDALGHFFLQKHRYNEAVEACRKSVEIKSDFINSQINLGSALGKVGKHEEAMEHFTTALRLNANDPEAHYNFGIVLAGHRDFATGVEHLRTACKLNPNYVDALHELAWMLATHPNPQIRNGIEAVRLASHAVAVTNGKDAGILETLAASYAESGDFPNALKWAQSAIALGNADEGTMARLATELQMYQSSEPCRDSSFN